MSTITITIPAAGCQPTQLEWDLFCKANGLALDSSGSGYFRGGGIKAGCDRNVATFTPAIPLDYATRKALRPAVSFWRLYGGVLDIDSELRCPRSLAVAL